MDVDMKAAYEAYLARFTDTCGDKPLGAFVKFDRHMVQKLDQEGFAPRLEHYLRVHKAAKKMLQQGATISDALVLELQEAAAWVAIKAPDLLTLFSGEMGDPEIGA